MGQRWFSFWALVIVWVAAVLGLKGLFAVEWNFASKAPNPHRGAYTAAKGDIIYFLGDDLNGEYDSAIPSFDRVWMLNATSMEWSWASSSGDVPERYGYFCSYIVGDNLYMFGGISWAGLVASNKMYAMNMSSFVWERIEYATTNRPKPVMQAACASHADKLFILGGYDGNPVTNFWEFNILTNTWSKISPKPNNQEYAAELVYAQMTTYEDSIVLFGGSDISYYFISKLWSFNLTTYEWGEPVEFVDIQSMIYTEAVSVYKNKLFIFGGAYDFGQTQLSSHLVIIDLDAKTGQEISSDTLNFKTNFPITAPFARIHAVSAVANEKLFIIGGKNSRRMNDFWVFDPETMKWIDNSLSRYPIGRIHPHLAIMSENKVAMYGGQVYLNEPQPMNDLWIYHTDNDSWERIVQESICLPTQATCGPAVLHAAFGYHESLFFLIGGYFPDSEVPIFKTYSLISKTWDDLVDTSVTFLSPGKRYLAASACIGSKIFIWGGKASGENTVPKELFVFDMENKFGAAINDSVNVPALRSQPKGFSMNGHFCFMDTTFPETYSNNREIWCYNQAPNVWSRTEIVSSNVANGATLAGFSTSLIVVGGLDTDENMVNSFHINDVQSNVWKKLEIDTRPPPIVDSSAIINDGSIFLFGGVSNDPIVVTGSVYRLELSKLWCDGSHVTNSSDLVLSDGSGDFDYFPSTKCSWDIHNTNFIVVEEMEIAPGALLSIETVSDCDKDIIFGDTSSNQLELSSLVKGSVVEMPSFKSLLKFRVSKNATPAQGFKLKMFACGKGFMADMNGCFCNKDHYVNFRGDCIACPTGSHQPLQNQQTCIKGRADKKQRIDLGAIEQTELVELSSDLPPIVFGSGCVIDSTIYIMGGSSSTDTNKVDKFYSLDVIYFTDSPVESSWSKMEMKGDIPAGRVQFCLVGMDGYGVLIGGKSSVRDTFIYFSEPSRKRWTRKSDMPSQIIGGMCARKEDSIYLFGGIDENGFTMNTLREYNPGLDRWESVKLVGNIPSIAFGSMVSYGRSLILFGGTNGQDENDRVLSINLDSLDASSTTTIKLEKCIECDEEGGICSFSRRNFAFGIHENKLHIYGGVRQGDVLADVNVIDLETSEVIFRENYGLNSPELPLSHPPPKFGAVFVMAKSSLMIVGGASKSNIVTNDVWTWDSDVQTWSDSSVSRSPIPRVESSFIKTSEKSFLIFGGATEYIEETLLNDIWEFDIVNQTWVCLFAGSSTLGPSPRARAMISKISDSIYIYGGRTESGKADDRVWTFDLGEKKWVIKDHINMLSTYQRPFNRIGISSVQTKNKLWMWGGQIIEGTKKTEFYSAALVFDSTRSLVYADNITGILPSKRSYHAVCTFSEDKVLVFGGKDFSGNNINDAWIYDIESKSWNSMDYASRLPTQLSNPTCGGFGAYSIINGINVVGGDKASIMLQHDFQRASNLFMSTKLRGYDLIFKQSSDTFGNLIIGFGGTNGYSTTNQIVAYKPGFCSTTPKLVKSEMVASIFDDGSGDGMYLENSNCTWTLPNATHIILQKEIRDMDRIMIYSLGDGQLISASQLLKRTSYSKLLYESVTGFTVRFISTHKGAPASNSPCEGCEGFTITHAACPLKSHLDVASDKCICQKGYNLQRDSCVEDSHSTSINYYAIIGGVIGGLLCMGIIGGYHYRKKMTENMKGAEKKLYGIIDPNELVYGKLLGSGSFGEVFQGEWRGTEVAIKVLLRNKINKEQIESFKREVAIMVELRHPNIVLYMGACFESEHLCLVCELMHQGSLYDVIHQEKPILYNQRLQFMSDISKGMQYLHMSNPPILHRDLKSLNILVDDRYRLKVSDFGLTTIQGSKLTEGNIGSLLWLAPEVIEGHEYTDKADVYSFGIIAWEIVSRLDPYYDVENASSVTTQVLMNQLRPTMPQDVPKEIKEFIVQLWNQDQYMRPTFKETSKKLGNLIEQSRFSSETPFSEYLTEEGTPPEGNACVVSTHIYGSETLWDDIPGLMADAIILHNKIIKKSCTKYKGYVSQNDGENYVIVFQEALQAIKFCSEVQIELNNAEWSREIMDHENAREQADGDLKGLRVQMALDYGSCTYKRDEQTGRRQYFGKNVSKAMKISRYCLGGQIIITDSVYQVLDDLVMAVEVENIIQIIKTMRPSQPSLLYEVYPKPLKNRLDYNRHLQALMPDTMIPANFEESHRAMSLPHTPASQISARNSPSSYHQSIPKNGAAYVAAPTEDEKEAHGQQKKLRERKGWEINFEELDMESKDIGSGSYGSVFVGNYKGKRVAVKKIANGKTQTTSDGYILFLSEVSIYRKLNHDNIVGFVGACIDLPNLAIVMELVEPGNLRQLLHDQSMKIGRTEKGSIIKGIIDGMSYLHSLNPVILHRDLKSANILVTKAFESKICDFGFARIKANNRTMTKCGTMVYEAPEVMKGERYNEKADVYSFGILLWEIECRATPYQGKDTLLLQMEVINGMRPEIHSSMDKSIVSLMQRCWGENPALRPHFRDLLGFSGDASTGK